MFDKQLYKRVLAIGVLTLFVFSGIACDAGETVAETKTFSGPDIETFVDVSSYEPDFGLASLELVISLSDVIAVVDLISVDRGLEKWKLANRIRYSKTLEFTFQVKEYLKGSGDEQIVGIIFDSEDEFDNPADAAMTKDPDPDRKEYWDDRKAVVFLRDYAKDPRLDWRTGRYYLGLVDEDGEYSIANRHYRAWLPAVNGDDQRFLLESDLGVSSPETITLDDLKGLISFIDQQLEGQTEEYQECVVRNYSLWSMQKHMKRYHRDDSTIGSGMPGATHIYTDSLAGFFVRDTNEYPLPPGGEDLYVLAGKDPEHFLGVYPGQIFTARPLPQGEYRVYHAYLPYSVSMCGGNVPDYAMVQNELFVNVTAPEGTLHEAFFDPVLIGKANDGSTVGALEPAVFTDANGVSGALLFILWEAESGGVGTVKLELSPHSTLAGHTLDFIALDGSVQLSLKVAEAEADETTGTLTWKVESQPWKAGDKLMLRIH